MSITDFMSNDHRHCDRLFADAEQAASEGAPAAALFEQFATELERHFQFEEAHLFPRFEDVSGMRGGPTMVMRHEHTQMRALVADLRQALASDDTERYLDVSETLLIMMQQHNLKEEQVLYPMTDEVLSQEREQLLEALAAE